ncbi:MAG TPA: alpha/beta hydrolase [Solirubrobacteraceae bacterium]|nr:alpha/beta hydrolase [Solirubrobacteraceae bacterium]
MLAFDRRGEGPPLLLLHGTTSSRDVWTPLRDRLAAGNDVIAVDLPGHGDSPPSGFTPPGWAREVADLLDEHGLERVAIVGHSAGGWTALELAKLGKAESVLALAPAGLWRERSPLLTDLNLNLSWRLGRALGPAAVRALRAEWVRSVALRGITAKARTVPADVAIASARAAIATDSFPRHFRETRVMRFCGGQQIEAPLKIVWGGRDRIALARKSRNLDQLPQQTAVETWPDCGHMLMWDAPDRVLEAVRAISA